MTSSQMRELLPGARQDRVRSNGNADGEAPGVGTPCDTPSSYSFFKTSATFFSNIICHCGAKIQSLSS